MPAYFDSNILISILQNDSHAQRAAELWDRFQERVASILIEMECLTVIRRLADAASGQLPRGWLSSTESLLDGYLDSVEIKEIDRSIAGLLRRERRLADCRTLDAIHLATALHFKTASEEPFTLCTFDQQMASTAKKLGLAVLPEG